MPHGVRDSTPVGQPLAMRRPAFALEPPANRRRKRFIRPSVRCRSRREMFRPVAPPKFHEMGLVPQRINTKEGRTRPPAPSGVAISSAAAATEKKRCVRNCFPGTRSPRANKCLGACRWRRRPRFLIGGGDSGGQHHTRNDRRGARRAGSACEKCVKRSRSGPSDERDQDAGIGAELPTPRAERGDELPCPELRPGGPARPAAGARD